MDLLELVHEDRSSSARPFRCEEPGCPKSFARRSDLVRHMRIHSNDRPFICHFEGCKRDFIQRSALTVHIRVHTGERPHHCEYEGCIKAFSDSSSLARHRRIHTGKRPYRCPVNGCTKKFCRRAVMSKHVKRNHPGDPLALTIEFEVSSGSERGNSPSGDEGDASPPRSRNARHRSASIPQQYRLERPPLPRGVVSEPGYYPNGSTSQGNQSIPVSAPGNSAGWSAPNSIDQQQYQQHPGQFRRIQAPQSPYNLPLPSPLGGPRNRSPEAPEECFCQQPPHRHYIHQHAPQPIRTQSQPPAHYLQAPSQEYSNPPSYHPQPQDPYRHPNAPVDMRFQRPNSHQQQQQHHHQHSHHQPQGSYSPAPIRELPPPTRDSYLPSIGQLTGRQHFVSPFTSMGGPPPPSPTPPLTHYSSAPPLYGQSAASQQDFHNYPNISPVLQPRRASSTSALEAGRPVDARHDGAYLDDDRGGPRDQGRSYSPSQGGDEGLKLEDDDSYFRRPSSGFPQSAQSQSAWNSSRGSFSSYVTQHIDRIQEGGGQYP